MILDKFRQALSLTYFEESERMVRLMGRLIDIRVILERLKLLGSMIRDAERGKGKWTLDDYVDCIDRMKAIITLDG